MQIRALPLYYTILIQYCTEYYSSRVTKSILYIIDHHQSYDVPKLDMLNSDL